MDKPPRQMKFPARTAANEAAYSRRDRALMTDSQLHKMESRSLKKRVSTAKKEKAVERTLPNRKAANKPTLKPTRKEKIGAKVAKVRSDVAQERARRKAASTGVGRVAARLAGPVGAAITMGEIAYGLNDTTSKGRSTGGRNKKQRQQYFQSAHKQDQDRANAKHEG